MICGLLGEKLSHSYSPQIHKFLGDDQYNIFEKSPDQLEDFLQNGDFHGLNVTIPYKKTVIEYCQELSAEAQRIGAVNTLVKRNDGSLIGHNTDYFGFRSMALRIGISYQGKKALVLGSGGASNTAVAVLEEMGANVVIVSRNGVNHYGNLHMHKDAAVLVNTTPVGMFPHTGSCMVDLDKLPNLAGVLDVIYNPARTKLLLDAEQRGLVTMNGLLMLVAQAKEAAEWFTDSHIDDTVIGKIHGTLQRQMENIILIGMPGCGKTTVGKFLAEMVGKTFVDADTEVELLAGKTIPEIFAQDGEEEFRSLEDILIRDFVLI